mmetsp:Transcript_11140/g.15910  ORF Transcript_11140/g.15910 Transcript_11140/m.15910 type:complete len:120 (+) Transcript_11140:160-519(+)|eukprot:CAMPEP_0202459856 /NCGR_PEP_ID=MMETSP1360-20130828/39400_1 /ASSEMBLY_ACC=CAM_ASM_000848 /TAXON_ID=515479 /ORGANISM="Licmophora paradoxa, Strain CCMP2313" /LENGTH=119 /DNA_ID=CAMNT_0049081195 /DNA_START=139 /DNA_END=498 /DNA_ORIENTATION=+
MSNYQSYQTGYVPPTYAEKQTDVLQETVQTQYQAEGTAQAVLAQLHAQRQQLQHADVDALDTRVTTEEARRALTELKEKMARKKRRLYMMIAALSAINFLLFCRLVYCGGSYFCRRRRY